jgi:excisionase family DNA binding protein
MRNNGRAGEQEQPAVDLGAFVPKILHTIPEAATLLSLGETKTRELVNAGEIDSVRVGRKVLVPRRELERYVERLQESE